MKKSLLAVVVGVAMLIPSVAFAGSSSSCQAYQTCSTTTTSPTPTTPTTPTTQTTQTAPTAPTAPSTGAASNTASTSPTEASSTGTLPFTGIDVAGLMVGASILLGGGLVMRYLSRDQQN